MKRLALLLLLVAPAGALYAVHAAVQDPSAYARGTVYHDRNRNERRDPGEEGLEGIRVSNGRRITQTDAQGRWRLPVDEDTALFVIKPRGWMTPLDANHLPRFYYLHKPNGSPAVRYGGVPPTGPLPESIDFPLHRQREPDRFRVVFFGDPQPRDLKEVEYIAHDVVEELVGIDAAFGVTLGDIVFDDLSVFEPLNGVIGLIGIPWYNVLGNHDINYDVPDDRHSTETFQRVYGPRYYSFDYGPTHFIVLDNIEWQGRPAGYRAGLDEEQIEFVRNDLKLVPEKQLVVLMMHIPLTSVHNRQEVYRLIERRPYTMSISGHTHYQEHKFITREDGWMGPEPHHHVINVTVSGSWWSGAPDERGIPHTLMRDGAPNGYSLCTFDGRDYRFEFRAASRDRSYQMNVYAPESVTSFQAGDTEVLANVFGGSERSKVEMRLGREGTWTTMERVAREDPAFVRLKQAEAAPNPPAGRKLPNVMKSPHIWRGVLPKFPPKGVHPIEVRTTDMFGQTYTAQRAIRIE